MSASVRALRYGIWLPDGQTDVRTSPGGAPAMNEEAIFTAELIAHNAYDSFFDLFLLTGV